LNRNLDESIGDQRVDLQQMPLLFGIAHWSVAWRQRQMASSHMVLKKRGEATARAPAPTFAHSACRGAASLAASCCGLQPGWCEAARIGGQDETPNVDTSQASHKRCAMPRREVSSGWPGSCQMWGKETMRRTGLTAVRRFNGRWPRPRNHTSRSPARTLANDPTVRHRTAEI